MEKVCFLCIRLEIGSWLLSNRSLACENITEASLCGIHVLLWSMSTLDLKQDPPRRICTHVLAASCDATCSECYRGIWLPLSSPCHKICFCLPNCMKFHEMLLQALVHDITVYWTTLLTPEQQVILDVLFWNHWDLRQASFNSTTRGMMVGHLFFEWPVFRLFLLGDGIKTNIVPIFIGGWYQNQYCSYFYWGDGIKTNIVPIFIGGMVSKPFFSGGGGWYQNQLFFHIYKYCRVSPGRHRTRRLTKRWWWNETSNTATSEESKLWRLSTVTTSCLRS